MMRTLFSPQWRWPVILGLLTAIGLAAALFGEGGPLWIASWAALLAPLAIAARQIWGRQPRR